MSADGGISQHDATASRDRRPQARCGLWAAHGCSASMALDDLLPALAATSRAGSHQIASLRGGTESSAWRLRRDNFAVMTSACAPTVSISPARARRRGGSSRQQWAWVWQLALQTCTREAASVRPLSPLSV